MKNITRDKRRTFYNDNDLILNCATLHLDDVDPAS